MRPDQVKALHAGRKPPHYKHWPAPIQALYDDGNAAELERLFSINVPFSADNPQHRFILEAWLCFAPANEARAIIEKIAIAGGIPKVAAQALSRFAVSLIRLLTPPAPKNHRN